MSVYVSATKQLVSPHAWTFAGLAVDDSGACYAAERKGLRDIKAKGLLVRYPNPFDGGGAPEVLHEVSDQLQGFFRAPSGETHLYGKKHHFVAKGKWKSKEITARAQRIVDIHGVGDRLFVAMGWPTAYRELVGDELRPVDLGLSALCDDIASTGPEDIYVATGDGMAHFDGATWRPIPGAPQGARLAALSRDEVYATGVEPEEGLVFLLYRGNAREGFRGVVRKETVNIDESFVKIVPALGHIYLLGGDSDERGLHVLRDDGIDMLMRATSYSRRAAGNAQVLWVENGIELLCFDGASWIAVPRVHHDKSKG